MSQTNSSASIPVSAIAARTALVLETNNLRGSDDLAQIIDSLKRVVSYLAQQTISSSSLAQWIITHDGLPDEAIAQIIGLAGRHVDFVGISQETGYYDAKKAGFDYVDAARCDYVVFGDADCKPDADWLEQLLTPFTRLTPDAPVVVAGRTSYAPGVFGVALTSIDFMYFPSPLRAGATANFYANDVAFRREVFERYHYEPLQGMYRGHCQVLGLRMLKEGIPVEYAPAAHTEHRIPDTYRETLKLRWMRGEDSVGLTPYLVATHLPRRWQWLGHSGPIGPVCVLATRFVYSLRALNHQHLPRLGAVRYLGAAVVMTIISALDMLGAIARGAGLSGRPSSRRHLEALSYHRR